MAIILDQSITGDGYDVRCTLKNGETRVYHFLVEPENVQAAVDALEDAYLIPLTLSQAKGSALERLESWYSNQLNEGISAGNYRFKATVHDQTRLASLATMVNTGLLAQVLTPASDVPSPLWDVNGVAHQMTVAEFMQAVLLYGSALGQLEGQYASTLAQINNADSVEVLEAILR